MTQIQTSGEQPSSKSPHTFKLEPLDLSHEEVLFEWMQDEDLRLHIGTVRPVNRIGHRRWIEAMANDALREAFVMVQDGVSVGVVYLGGIDLVYRKAEISIYLGESAARGRGVAQKGLQEVLRWAFDTLGLHRIEARTFAFNARASAFFERAGFVAEGRERDAAFKQGQFVDMNRFSLLASDWRKG